ncbi:MAG TPA: ABC transporter substrate-binding protein, partial [Paenibacillus cookii]|nr:ABC transporter substrate-binding protein [Paenibacillus cookii]
AVKYDPPAMQPKPAFTDEENEVLSVTGQAVKKYREENFSKFVLGTRSLNEWDQYVKEINGLGVQKLIDTYDAALKRVEETKLENK